MAKNEAKIEITEEQSEYNPKLDLSSVEFDPILALNTPGVIPPVPNSTVYDNLALYKSAMEKKKCPEKFRRKKEKEAETTAPVARRWLPHQMPIPTLRKQRYKRNIFSKMEKMAGPLALLNRCVQEKLRIKVYTRNEKTTRGYCLAYIVAFDKHFNMALEDVTEIWTRRKKKKIPALDSAISVKKFKFQRQFKMPEIKVAPHPTKKKLENCTRHVDQLLLRGEHVVLVCADYQEKNVNH